MDAKRLLPPRGRSAVAELVVAAFVGTARRIATLLRATTQPAFVIAVMLVGGGGCAVAGVWMLAGTGWSLIAAATVLFGLAGLGLRGMMNG